MILHTICGRVMKDESPNVCSCSFNLCSLLNLPQFSGSLLAVFSYNAIILIFDLHLFFREKCWLPNVTLTSYVQRETNPKAPVPIPHRYNESELRYRPHVLRQAQSVVDPSIKKTPPNPELQKCLICIRLLFIRLLRSSVSNGRPYCYCIVSFSLFLLFFFFLTDFVQSISQNRLGRFS